MRKATEILHIAAVDLRTAQASAIAAHDDSWRLIVREDTDAIGVQSAEARGLKAFVVERTRLSSLFDPKAPA